MIFEFNPARLIFYSDLERCPYPMWSDEAFKWGQEDTKRMMLIALERYVMILDYVRKTRYYHTKAVYVGLHDDDTFYAAMKRLQIDKRS